MLLQLFHVHQGDLHRALGWSWLAKTTGISMGGTSQNVSWCGSGTGEKLVISGINHPPTHA